MHNCATILFQALGFLRKAGVAAPLLIFAFSGAFAQQSPYASQVTRTVKTLSDQEIDDYLDGRGMGFAKAAELNGYPGPAHVLELGEALRLTPEQRARTQQLYDSMHASAVAVGRDLVESERQLDASFSDKSVTTESLAAAVRRIALLQGQLREIHLKAHVAQVAALTPEQIRRYDELRGYRDAGSAATPHVHRTH